jgi:uncharacterized membrane protein YjjP (DUF1212 family)
LRWSSVTAEGRAVLRAAQQRLARLAAHEPTLSVVPEPDEETAYRLLTSALRAGAILLGAGAATLDVEQTVLTFAHALGLVGCEVDVTFTSLTGSYRRPGSQKPITTLVVVRNRTLNFARLASMTALRVEVLAHRLSALDVEQRLEAIERLAVRRGRFVVVGWAGMAAAFTVLLGGQLLASAIGFVATAVVYLLNRGLARRGVPDFFLSALGAAIATSAALGATSLHLPVEPALVVAGGIMALVPGVKLVSSVQDALTGFPLSGTARGVEVLLIATGIVTGVSVVLYVGNLLGAHVGLGPIPLSSLLYLPVQIVAAGIAAALYAIATSVPKPFLLYAALTGALSWAIALVLVRSGVSLVIASAIAAVAVGALAQLLASWHTTHPFLFVVPGIMPLVPGLTVFEGMLALVEGRPGAAGLLLQALAIGLAIAAGVTLGYLVLRAPANRPNRLPTGLRRPNA